MEKSIKVTSFDNNNDNIEVDSTQCDIDAVERVELLIKGVECALAGISISTYKDDETEIYQEMANKLVRLASTLIEDY